MSPASTVTVRVNVRLFLVWLALLRGIAFLRLMSEEQIMRLAERGRWLVLVKVGTRKWTFLR